MTSENTTRIIPLGGCGEFGLNLTIYMYGLQAIVVDSGIRFSDPAHPGTNGYLPDYARTLDLIDPDLQIMAYVITHGHEDHIGSLPFIHEAEPAKVFATWWTAELINNKFDRWQLDPPMIHITKPGDETRLGPFRIKWFHVNHSIPMSCGLLIETPNARIVHTGDFKVDPLAGEPDDKMDLGGLSQLAGEDGVDLLVCDSTNSSMPGRCPSESSVTSALENVIRESKRRVYLTTFASNAWRVLTVMEAAKRTGKKVGLHGRSLVNTLALLQKKGWFTNHDQVWIDDKDVFDRVPLDKQIILCTGCQGEPQAAMSRYVNQSNHHFAVSEKDTVIFSSRIIPGSERKIYDLLSSCKKRGAVTITSREEAHIHVSGHAYSDDVKDLIEAFRPRNFMPVHGTYVQTIDNLSAHQSMIAEKSIYGENAKIYEIDSKKGMKIAGQISPPPRLIVDSDSNLVMAPFEIRPRFLVGEKGCLVVFIATDRDAARVNVGLDWIGLTFPRRFSDQVRWDTYCRDLIEKKFASLISQKSENVQQNLQSYIIHALAEFYNKNIVVRIHWLKV